MEVYIGCLIIYIILMVGISAYSRKKLSTSDDFMLAGRSVPPWMSAFSYGTAYFSAVIFIGFAGKSGWIYGFSIMQIVIGNTILGSYLAWQVLGKKTRRMTHKLKASTMPEFLFKRYDSRGIKIIASVIIFLFLIPYAASVYKGLGYLFLIVFQDLSVNVILTIMMALTALYLFMGGFLAATLADFIQGVIMIVGVIALIYYVLTYPTVGGLSNGMKTLQEIDPDMTKLISSKSAIPILSVAILTSLGNWGLPQMVHKFYTIKDEKSIKTAKWISTGFALLIATGACLTGSLSRVVLGGNPPMENGQIIFESIMPEVINTALPTFAAAIILVLILSASMSTLASLILASSSTISVDLIKGTLKPNLSEKKMLLLLRILSALFVFVAFLLAMGESPILNLATLSWGVVSGVLLAPYLLGLYWKGVTKTGVYASIVSALLIMLFGVIKFGIASQYIPTVACISMICPVFVLIIVSLFTKKYSAQHIENIFENTKDDEDTNSLNKRKVAS